MSVLINPLSPAFALAQRELVRFLRQRNRVIGALATPIIFWLLLGFGMGRSFSAPGSANYIEYFFPGTVLMILLFTAIFSTISVIEDRREGFLQSVLVAPVSRASIVLGKTLGGAVLATGQGLIFLLLAPTIGIHLSIPMLLASVGVMFILSFGLTALGLVIAWRMNSTQGFHAIMNLFLMPMWFLSGALFPVRDEMPRAFKAVMLANPLTYGLDALRATILWQHPPVGPVNYGMQLLISIVAAGVVFGLALFVANQHSAADTP